MTDGQPPDAPENEREDEQTLQDLAELEFDRLTGADVPATNQARKMGQRAQSKADQTHTFRERFFDTVVTSVGFTLFIEFSLMGVYVVSQWGEISPTVMVSFNAAVVVNVLGLAFIVANYLFPSGGGDHDDS